MRKRICLLMLVFFCLLLTACAPAAQPEPEPDPAPEVEASAPEDVPAPGEPREPDVPEEELSERDQNWVNDIHYLQYNYKMYHPDPFYLCSEEEFDWKIDLLCKKVTSLSDNDIFFELAAVIAGMGDIHTAVFPPESLYDSLFPIGVQYFDNKLYLSFYREGYEQFEPYLLREIVAVNGVDIRYLEGKFESIFNPYNTWYSEKNFCRSYFIPAFFDWAGCGYRDGYTFQILDENRTVQSVEVPVMTYAEAAAGQVIYPEGWQSSAGVGESNWAEYVEGENGGYVYMNLEQMTDLREAPYRELFEKTAGLLETHPDSGKLVIDLRNNPGGLILVCNYLREDVQMLKELPIDQTYILTSGYTASGGTFCISLFKKELDGVIVGEPTGQFTSFFGYQSNPTGITLTLPLSQLSVRVATGWWEGDSPENVVYDEDGKLYAWENTILPDVYVYQDIEDLRRGKDSVLEWVLAQ